MSDEKAADLTSLEAYNRALRRRVVELEAELERAPRAGDERYRALFAQATVGVAEIDSHSGRFLKVNQRYGDIVGRTPKEMLQLDFQAITYPEDFAADLERMALLRAGKLPSFEIEKRYVRPTGELVWVRLTVLPLWTAPEPPSSHIAVVEEITESKRTEAALQLSEERFRLALQGGHIVVFSQDMELRYTWIHNPSPAFDAATVLGKTDAELLSERDAARLIEFKRNILTTGLPARQEMEVHVDGRSIYYDLFVEPMREAAEAGGGTGLGRVIGLMGVAVDVTERKRAEQATLEAKAQLEEADRRKDEFLAMLGHELRNPLAAIRTATDLLGLATLGDSRIERAHGVLERQSAAMSRLVDGLLDVSRIARGKIELRRETLDMRSVVGDVLHDRASQIERRGLTLTTDLPSQPAWVHGDPVRLTQVFDNLIGNAIKFTRAPGSVHVSLEVESGHAIVRVRDTGIGIRPDVLPQLFEPFHQETQDIARTAGGLGLGLAVARGLVELHGGTIQARNAGPEAGAEFEVRLPLSSARADERNAERAPDVARRRVLIVEDNPDAGPMMRELLELLGHEATVVETGTAALDAVRRRGVDVVLCDLGLPDVSGYEVAREIRGDPALHDIPLVALTGYGQPADRKRTLEAGFDEHLTKPIDRRALEAAIERHTRPRR